MLTLYIHWSLCTVFIVSLFDDAHETEQYRVLHSQLAHFDMG